MPSASVLLRSSSTPFLHIHRPHHPSEHAMSHPWDTHQCHVKHPPAMQAPLRLTASPRASCTAGSNPAELLVVAGSSASARDQPFEAPQCQTFSPAHPPLQAGCLATPLHCTWEASRLCLAQGHLSQGEQEMCWERGLLANNSPLPG